MDVKNSLVGLLNKMLYIAIYKIIISKHLDASNI